MFALEHCFFFCDQSLLYATLFDLFFCPLAPARWHCWPRQSGTHTKLGGGLVHSLSPAEKDNWWLFTHSPKCHLSNPKQSRCPRKQWCHSEREETWSRGVAGLGPWHSRSHYLYSEGCHLCTVDGVHQAHWTREVVCAARPPYCVRPGMQAERWLPNLMPYKFRLKCSRCQSVFYSPLFIQGWSQRHSFSFSCKHHLICIE